MRLICLLILLAAPAAFAQGEASPAAAAAAPAPLAHPAAHPAVGRLGARAPDQLGHCTATLVAPDRALTAAHCVTRLRLGRLIPLVGMPFFAGADAEGRPYAARVTDVLTHPRADAGGGELDRRFDVALLRLDPAIPIEPLPLGVGFGGGAARMEGFPRGGPLAATVQAPCAAAPGPLWRLNCPVRSGQSGSPVFLEADASPTVIAVVVATTGGDALAVPVDTWLLQQLEAPPRSPTLP